VVFYLQLYVFFYIEGIDLCKDKDCHNHENLVISTRRNAYNQGRGQEILQIPEAPIYNHGREAIPIANNNEKLSLQNIDEGLLQHLVQTVRQEVTQNLRQETQNNGQASNSNIIRNNYYH